MFCTMYIENVTTDKQFLYQSILHFLQKRE